MGHGSIHYQGGMMVNSHEGIATEIGRQLKLLAEKPHYSAIQVPVEHWLSELEAPNGCSAIKLDAVLSDEKAKSSFVEALTELHAGVAKDRPRTKQLIRQVLLLLNVGEHALDEGYRPTRPVQPWAS